MAIAVSCASCGKQYKVSNENAGKKVRCKCGASLRVPQSGAKKKAAPAAKPATEDALFSFETTPGEGLLEESGFSADRPAGVSRKKGGGFPLFRVVLVPLFVLLMVASVGVLVAVVYEVPAAVRVAEKLHLHPEEWRGLVLAQPEIDSDVRYFPDNTQVVAIVNIKHLLDSQAYKQLEEEAAKTGINLNEWKKLGGELTLDDVQRISVGLSQAEHRPSIAVVRFNRKITPEEVQDAPMLTNLLFGLGLVAEGKEFSVSKPEEFKFERSEIGKQKHVVYDSPDFSFALVGDRGVAFGPKEVLHHALERKSRNRLSRRLQEELARAEPSESVFVWAMTASAIPPDYRERLENQLGDDYVKKVEAMSVSLRVDHDISVNTTLFCKDDAAAEAIAKEAGEKLNAATKVLSYFKDAPKDLFKATSATAGRRYTASITTDADKIVKGKQAVTRFLVKSVTPDDEEKPKEKEKGKDKEVEKGKDKAKTTEKGKDAEKDKAKDKTPEKGKEAVKDKTPDKEKAKE